MPDDRIYATELAAGENTVYERVLSEQERRQRIHYDLVYRGDSLELESRLVSVIARLRQPVAQYALERWVFLSVGVDNYGQTLSGHVRHAAQAAQPLDHRPE